jgi:hypothetical protein
MRKGMPSGAQRTAEQSHQCSKRELTKDLYRRASCMLAQGKLERIKEYTIMAEKAATAPAAWSPATQPIWAT